VSLHKKIVAIQAKVNSVPKSGYNAHFKYDYASEKDLLDILRPLCAEQGISLIVDCVQFEVDRGWAKVLVKLTLTDAETGESISIQMPGYAEDKADKQLAKAITSAAKYAYWKAFALSTGDDPEKEEDEAPKPAIKKPGNFASREDVKELWEIAQRSGYTVEDLRKLVNAERVTSDRMPREVYLKLLSLVELPKQPQEKRL